MRAPRLVARGRARARGERALPRTENVEARCTGPPSAYGRRARATRVRRRGAPRSRCGQVCRHYRLAALGRYPRRPSLRLLLPQLLLLLLLLPLPAQWTVRLADTAITDRDGWQPSQLVVGASIGRLQLRWSEPFNDVFLSVPRWQHTTTRFRSRSARANASNNNDLLAHGECAAMPVVCCIPR
jgi:hypothetical protein